MKNFIIELLSMIVIISLAQMIISHPNIEPDRVEIATEQLETDIKNEDVLQDHYVIYDDGKENVVALTAKKTSQMIVEVIRLIVIFFGDFFSIMIG